MNYIRVKNWNEYQHYKDRAAPWIKLHKELLSSHFWVMGSDASKLLAICIMLLAQRNDNKIPADFEYIKRFGHLETYPDFQPLIDAQLIEIFSDNECLQDASKALASCYPDKNRIEEIYTPSDKHDEPLPEKPKPSSKKKPTQLPADFCISDRVGVWAKEHEHQNLAARLEHFVGYAKANGKTYADWDAAFMNAIRDDWAKLGKPVDRGKGEWLEGLGKFESELTQQEKAQLFVARSATR